MPAAGFFKLDPDKLAEEPTDYAPAIMASNGMANDESLLAADLTRLLSVEERNAILDRYIEKAREGDAHAAGMARALITIIAELATNSQ